MNKIVNGLLAVILLACILFFLIGTEARQRQIEKNALEMKYKNCYDWQDIEMIIHGEIQE